MTISHFVFFENKERPATCISEGDRHGICKIIKRTPGLLKAHVYAPAILDGPFRDDRSAPQFALQLHFSGLQELEAVIAPEGHPQALASPGAWPSLAGTVAAQSACDAHFDDCSLTCYQGVDETDPVNRSSPRIAGWPASISPLLQV